MSLRYGEVKFKQQITSNQSNTRIYNVCLGEVDWGNGKFEVAVYVQIELPKELKKLKNYTAHILTIPGADGRSDFDNVMDVLIELREKYREYL
jgi:hypothetical protein